MRGLGGLPLFEGQALLSASCGNGAFCHSEVTSFDSRQGVPAGLELDVRLACDQRAPAETCTQEEIDRLHRNQARAYRYAPMILQQVASGAMPPGEAGQDLREAPDAPHYLRADGSRLPEVESAEGQEILRNWLACGAPVLEISEDVIDGRVAGEYCGDGTIGDCVYGEPRSVEPPEPNWPSIYARVIEPLCGVSCHGPGPIDYRVESQLDLSDIDVAYDQMVGVTASGAYCLMDGRPHISTEGGPEAVERSLFYEKLGADPSCGDRMPQGGPFLPASVMDAIAEWIEAGAPRRVQ